MKIKIFIYEDKGFSNTWPNSLQFRINKNDLIIGFVHYPDLLGITLCQFLLFINTIRV